MDMEKKIKISVIVPVYNSQKYLMRCLKSLICQSLQELEIILVDDGSQEECARFCDELEKMDSRIQVIHKKNEGLGFARNTGIEIARGKYVAFVDSDDYVDSSMYEELYEAIEREHAQIAVGGYRKKYGDGREEIFTNKGIPKILGGEQIYSVLLANMLGAPPEYYSDDYIGMSVWKNLYKREIIENYQVRFPSEREFISEDIVFHIHFLRHVDRAVVLDSPFYYYCQNASSLSTTYKVNRFEKIKKLYLYEKELLEEMEIFELGKLQLQRTFIANVRFCIMLEAARGKYERKDAKRSIDRYCADEELQQVLRGYPCNKLPIKQRIFSIFMIHKNTRILYILACCHNKSISGKRARL